MIMATKITYMITVFLTVFVFFAVNINGGVLQEVAERTDTVMGVEGESVKLPCDIRPPSTDDEVALILWYKDESTTPLYSLDSRRRGLHLAKHASAPEVSDRVHLLTNESPSYLRLQKLRTEDEGEYKCRVDFKIARSRNVVVILEIITPPKTPAIKNSKGALLQRVTGPHNEGSRLYLRCDVEGGKPPPSVTWWKDSILLDETYQVFPKSNIVRNELLIPSLYRSDLHSVYTCQASNNNVSNPVTASVTVDMNLPPVEVLIEEKSRPLSANKPVELVCRAGGSRPPANITWDIGRGPLKGSKAKISSEGNITMGKLTFVPKIEDRGKNVTCRAENSLLRGKAIFDVWTIDVHYIPQLTLRLGSKLRHSHIQEGKDVYLECSVVSNPPATDVGWRFEGRELHTNKSAGIIVSSQSLVLQKVKKSNRGRYTCTAENSEGRGESSPLYLRVQYTPVCKPNQKTLYGVARHEPVKVTCDVEADPSKTNFTWRFNNSVESLDIMTFVNEDSRSIATYIPRTEYDYGTLLCWGRNVIGAQRDPCVFTVIPAGPPDPVTNCSTSNETEDSLLVRCQEGYDGGLQQMFILEVYDSADMTLVVNMTNMDKPHFTAFGLPSGTSFVAVVYAENAKQRSKGVVVRANTLATPESLTQRDNHWPSSFSPVLIILIIVLAVLVLVALTLVCAVKTRNRHPPEKDLQKHGQDKSLTPLRQDTDDRREGMMMPTLLDIEDKGPDVIPGMELGIEQIKDSECKKPDIQRDDMPRDRRILCSSSPSPTQLNAMECPSEWGLHHKPLLKQVPSPSVPQMPQKNMQPLLEYISPTQQQQQMPSAQLIASPTSNVRAEWTLPRSSSKVKNRQTDV